MNKAEKTALLDILSGLAEYFNYELTKYIITAYLEDLNEYSILQIKKAASVIRKNSKYFPKIAEIIETINIIDGNINLSLDDRAEIAWSLVLKAVDKFGTYYSFTFKDKAIRKALDIINYTVICDTLESKLNWIKADFIKVYKTFAKLDPLSYDASDYIASFIELGNNQAAISDLTECSAFYVGKSVNIVEDDIKVNHDALSNYLSIGGQSGRKELE